MVHTGDRRSGDASVVPNIAIIGAGISGICMGVRLKQRGIDSFTIYEKSDRLGGTWRDNTYPGAGCDVPSMLYSFSFAPNPEWSRKFSAQSEILTYLERVAERWGITPHIRFGVEIAGARFDADAGAWEIRTTVGDTIAARVLVAGCGQLHRPRYPDIPGRDGFEGRAFHSARWDHGCDLRGTRVAVIGTGASAIQLVPPVADAARRLFVFQRSPSYVVEKPDRAFRAWERAMFRAVPKVSALYRAFVYWQLELRGSAVTRPSWLGRWYAKVGLERMREQVRDPALHEPLSPDYPLGCKRILISNDYYDTLVRDDVDLVTSPIERIERDAIVTADGARRAVDVIVYATGFQSTAFLAPMRIQGLSGRWLADEWRGGARAYLGIAVSGFPNFYLLYGPNTNLGHNSIIFMIERQVGYVVQCIQALVDRDLRYLDLRRDVMERYDAWVQEQLARSSWAADCSNWYKDESGRITNNWPGSTVRYWWKTRRLDLRAYHQRRR